MSDEADATEAIVDRLSSTPDVKEKVDIVGLLRKPFTHGDMDQACATCIYFLPRHAHCGFPQLDFPVQPDWWCRLWRV